MPPERWVLLGGLVLLACSSPASTARRPGGGSRAAAEGLDPMPDGALARIGSPRYRPGPVRAAAFVDGARLITISPDGRRVAVWDEGDGHQVAESRDDRSFAAAVSADGDRLVRVTQDERGRMILRATALPSGELVAERALPAEDVGFHVALRVLADDRIVLGWDPGSGPGCVQTYAATLERLDRVCSDRDIVGVALSPDGRHAALLPAYVDPAPELRILDLTSGDEVASFAVAHATTVTATFSGDGGRLAYVDGDDVHVVAVSGWRPEATVRVATGGGVPLALDASGDRLAASDGREVTIVAVPSGDVLGTVSAELAAPLEAVALSPDGARAAFAVAGGLFRAEVGRDWADRPPDFRVVADAALSRDGATVAIASADDVCFHDARSGRELRCTSGGSAHLVFTADGAAVVASDRNQLRVIPVAAGQDERVIDLSDEGDRYLFDLGLSPDGATLIVPVDAETGGTSILVIDLASGERRHELDLPSSALYIDGIAFSSDGARFAYSIPTPGGSSSIVRVHDLATGKLVAEQPVSAMMPRALALLADGGILAEDQLRPAGGGDDTVPALAAVSADARHAVLGNEGDRRLWPLDRPVSEATPLPALPGKLHDIAPSACEALTCDDAQLCFVWDVCN